MEYDERISFQLCIQATFIHTQSSSITPSDKRDAYKLEECRNTEARRKVLSVKHIESLFGLNTIDVFDTPHKVV